MSTVTAYARFHRRYNLQHVECDSAREAADYLERGSMEGTLSTREGGVELLDGTFIPVNLTPTSLDRNPAFQALLDTGTVPAGVGLVLRPPAEMTTPDLVREFADHRVRSATQGRAFSAGQHARLGVVVTELRRRHVLD